MNRGSHLLMVRFPILSGWKPSTSYAVKYWFFKKKFKKIAIKKNSIIQLLAVGKNRNWLAVVKIGIMEDLDCGSGYE
jgi:hypothetical protein